MLHGTEPARGTLPGDLVGVAAELIPTARDAPIGVVVGIGGHIADFVRRGAVGDDGVPRGWNTLVWRVVPSIERVAHGGCEIADLAARGIVTGEHRIAGHVVARLLAGAVDTDLAARRAVRLRTRGHAKLVLAA